MDTIILEKSHPLFTYFVERPKKLKFDTCPDGTQVKLVWTIDASEQRRINYKTTRRERYRELHPKKEKLAISQYEKEKLGLVKKRKSRNSHSECVVSDNSNSIDPQPATVL